MNLVNLYLVSLFLSTASTSQWDLAQSKVVGGHEAKPHSHPYLISLQLRFLWLRMHVCGGALLNRNWILSAAHCISESWIIRWLPLDAIAGAHDINYFDRCVQISEIAKRIPHPKYPGGIGPYDIAVLRTSTPFTMTQEIQPINLPVVSESHIQSLALAGWGVLKTTAFIPDLPSKLQEVEVTYIPYHDCYEALEEIKDEGEETELDKDAHLCTGPLTGGIAACNGDSGGPLIQYYSNNVGQINYQHKKDKTKTNLLSTKGNTNEDDIGINTSSTPLNNVKEDEKYPVIIGVVSWGISPCGEKGAPTVYTNVSRYLNFIYDHINN